ncbi:MAG: hydrolase [Planctomycetes bacterium SCN 63-9]|nr:MAG: hydrolase [Planctomycetes bacterium SCN 63-9]
MRRWIGTIALVITIFPCLSSAGHAQGAPANVDRTLDIYFIDVLGGAATLIVTPEKESVLIDSGWAGFEDRDPKRIVHVLKDVAKLDGLDHLVTTHWHADHYGGVAGLSKLVDIRNFWDRGLPEDNEPGLEFPDGPKVDNPLGIAYRKASAGKRHSVKAGDALPLQSKVKGVVLTSGGKVIPDANLTNRGVNPACEDAPADFPVDPSDNARSLTIRFTLGKFGFLDCGDLTWNVEKQLVCPIDRIGTIDLFQVTHHGADNSNHPTLLKTIAPTVAITNNGPRKGGTVAAYKRLRATPSIQAIYQLHRNAATSAEDNTDPALIANADPTGGQFIHVTVAPDGSSFSVQFGENGKKREFQSK